MTVVHPNHIVGINSITVLTGDSLSIHKNDGSLIRTIVSNTGVSTFSSLHVGSGTTTSTQGISVGIGCSIVSTTDNQLEFYTDSSERLRIGSDGFISHYGSATFQKAGSTYIRIGSTDAGGAILGLDGDSNGDGSGADYCMIKHDTDGHLKIIGDNPANAADIQFYSNTATERLRILSSGQVNIGGNYTQTTYTMQVTGTINATTDVKINGSSAATTGKAIAMAMIFG